MLSCRPIPGLGRVNGLDGGCDCSPWTEQWPGPCNPGRLQIKTRSTCSAQGWEQAWFGLCLGMESFWGECGFSGKCGQKCAVMYRRKFHETTWMGKENQGKVRATTEPLVVALLTVTSSLHGPPSEPAGPPGRAEKVPVPNMEEGRWDDAQGEVTSVRRDGSGAGFGRASK